MTSESLALVSIAISTVVAFVGALVRTLYQRDSEQHAQAITELKRKIELLDASDSKLSERVHSQENRLTEIWVTLKAIDAKIDTLVRGDK
jgi:septal ring factor EnvC (AmiA/AmiB activator)